MERHVSKLTGAFESLSPPCSEIINHFLHKKKKINVWIICKLHCGMDCSISPATQSFHGCKYTTGLLGGAEATARHLKKVALTGI